MAQISWFAPSEDPRKHKFGVVADNASIGGGGAVKEPGHFEAGAPTGFFPGAVSYTHLTLPTKRIV